MTGWADKKPLGDIALLLEHRVKTIFVPAGWANFKLVFHLDSFNIVIHAKLPIEI